MNGYSDTCADCLYFHLVTEEEFYQYKERLGRYRDGICSKEFPRGYVKPKKPYIKWHKDAACFQFEPKHNI